MAQISLIMTVYNRADLLHEAIESALAQTCSDFELIIWDDGSTDSSLEIAQRYATQDRRIQVFAAPHQGRAPALVSAIAESKAPLFGILDSDDRLGPTALAETVPVIEADPDIAIVYTRYQLIDHAGAVLGVGPAGEIPYSPERLLVEQMVFHFRLFRREIYDEVGGFDPQFDCAEDYDLVIRLSEAGEIVQVPKILYDYRTHDNRISAQQDLKQIEWSRRAIENALARRGVADKIRLDVRISAQFSLVPRTEN